MPKEIFHPVSLRRPRGKNPPLPRPINRGPHPAAGPDFAIGTALLMTVLRVATGLASEDEPSDNPSVLTANETLARAGFPAIPENARELECYAWTGLGTGISATFLLKRPALAPFPASFPGLDEPPPVAASSLLRRTGPHRGSPRKTSRTASSFPAAGPRMPRRKYSGSTSMPKTPACSGIPLGTTSGRTPEPCRRRLRLSSATQRKHGRPTTQEAAYREAASARYCA